ncbi:hypothetical protein BGZ96_007641 [Linnemannia gamsii]|uniref:Carboxypeptidase n=1 Tax=Linnemannia gamsii TaxID=64522 RepID=A0ABQ7KH50_9FUNG|nr:hypothetical protein BGZ96_007641 [Linnemannia gamsii]
MLRKTVGLSTLFVLTATVAILTTTNATSSSRPTQQHYNRQQPTVEAWTAGETQKNDRQEHRVGPLPWAEGEDPIRESYAGNFPIRQWTSQDGSKADAEMFYWFFPALKPKVKDPPLIIWLQGGPGASSMIGLFYETGPIHVTENFKLTRSNITWANEYSMLFVEQPVGTGYSFVDQRYKRKKVRGGEDDESDNDDEGDATGLSAGDDDDDDDGGEEKDDGGRFAEMDAELEKDQEDEATFFATLPSSQSFEFKASAASKRHRITEAGNDNDEDEDSMYTKSGYVKDQRAVVKDMMVFLDQFYNRYPEQQRADLYIAGQSYAGKFIPSIAHAIMERNKKLLSKMPENGGRGVTNAGPDDLSASTGTGAEVAETTETQTTASKALLKQAVIPIKGISMGNPMTDPITQIQIHADHAFYLGLITAAQADQMREYQSNAIDLVQQGRFLDANRFRGKIFNLFRNSSGNLNTFDIRKGSHGMNWKPMTALLNQPAIKDSLNVFGPRTTYLIQQGVPKAEVDRIEKGRKMIKFRTDLEVKKAMRGDIMRSVKPLVADLLDNGVKVLAYQGIFDFRDAPAGSTKWIEGLDWKRREAFLQTERKVWKVGGFTAGYVNSVGMKKGEDGGLTRIVMLGGGHYTPMNEPKNCLVMIRHLIDGIRLDEK